jgi:hypothetical protein
MDRIDREIRERHEKVHLWSTDAGYMCGPCYRKWLPEEAARQHAAEPDEHEDDGDFIEDIDHYQVGHLREGDLWEFEHWPITCEKCGRDVVVIRTEYGFPVEEQEEQDRFMGRSSPASEEAAS